MVATSPMRHDVSAVSPNGHPIHPVDVHPYEPPWKALCDFALHSDLERPGYNHLVNEMHGYDYGRPPPPPPHLGGGPPPYTSGPMDPMGGDPYLEGPMPPTSSHGSMAPPSLDNSYTLTSLDNEA